MKKLALAALLAPAFAFGQTFPTPIFSSVTLQNPLTGANGGTGVANSSTITLGGNLTTSGANPVTFTTTGSTNVTLPTSGTLLNGSSGATAGANSNITSLSGLTTPLSVSQGGTGVATSTGSGSVVLNTSPSLTTPALGTPSSVTLTNAMGLPISTGVSGLGTGVATGLGNAATGSGSPVLATSPTISGVTVTGSLTATGLVTLADIATQAANTVMANVTGSTASPTAFVMPSCSSTGNDLNWTSGSGFTCATGRASLGLAQTFTATQMFSNSTYSALFTGGPVGVGISSPAVPLDVEAPNSTGGGNANSTLARFYAGSSGTPVTTVTPTVAISRYEAINNQDTEGGQNAALYVEDIANNVSGNPPPPVAQVNGITSNVFQNGTGDSVGMFAYSTNSSTNSGHTAYGGFFDAIANSAGTHGFGLEVDSTNSTGSNVGYTGLSPYPGIVGIHVQAAGANLNTAGIWIGNVSSSPDYDVGIAVTNDINTTAYEDDSSSVQSLYVTGTHTYGVNLANGTYTGASIVAPGFEVSSSGSIESTVTPTTSWEYDSTGSHVSIANGGNAPMPAGNGLIVVEDSGTSNTAAYLCSNAACALIGANGGTWVASTGAPASGHSSVAYSSGEAAYVIINNEGATETMTVSSNRMKTSN
jgi:hypothetical protein